MAQRGGVFRKPQPGPVLATFDSASMFTLADMSADPVRAEKVCAGRAGLIPCRRRERSTA